MSRSFRRFRFVRETARAQWYIDGWIYASFVLSMPLLVFLLGAQRSAVAWAACAAVLALIAWRWWQQRAWEAAFWERKRGWVVWFEDGCMHAASDGAPLPRTESLEDVAAVDVVFERGKPVRLLADKADGSRTVYTGFDDMDAFAAEFRSAAPHAKFRHVRLAFPMKLKEI